MLDRRQAEQIATKLGAESTRRTGHTLYVAMVNNEPYPFGVRHGRTSDHTHLVKSLRYPLSKLKKLASCDITREQYEEYQRLRGTGG